MKKILIILLVLTSLSIYGGTTLPSGWKKGSFYYKQYIKTIRKNKIPMILYVYSQWCPYCKKMNKKLSNNKVQKYLKGFIKVAVDGGGKKNVRPTEVNNVMDKYNITGFPTLMLIYPNGRIKNIAVNTKLSDKEFFNKLKKRIGTKAYKMSKKNNNIKDDEELDKKEISDLYSGNGTKPKIIEFSDNVGEHSNMRAYKVVTENKKSRYHNNLGDVYLVKKKYEDAASEYLDAIKYDKKNQRAFYGLARVFYKASLKSKGYRKLKQLRQARTYIKTAMSYTGAYMNELKELSKKVEKNEAKENKKYKSYKR